MGKLLSDEEIELCKLFGEVMREEYPDLEGEVDKESSWIRNTVKIARREDGYGCGMYMMAGVWDHAWAEKWKELPLSRGIRARHYRGN